jgi:hypothetical protein
MSAPTTREIDLASRIRASPDVVSRDLEGEAVILDLRTRVSSGLDAVTARVWHLLHDAGGLRAVLECLRAEYGVTEAPCPRGPLALVSGLRGHGLVEVLHRPAS